MSVNYSKVSLPSSSATHGVEYFSLSPPIVTVVGGLGLVTLDMTFSRPHDTSQIHCDSNDGRTSPGCSYDQ